MSGRRAVRFFAVAAILVALLTAAGCGGKHFATTKFVLHAGLAFGAFHHYIYTPAKAGDFSHPLQHKAEVVKAGVAAVFVLHELKIAYADAKASKVLSKLTGSVGTLVAKLDALAAKLKLGQFNVADVLAANAGIAEIVKNSPVPIKDLARPSLGH
jgi:hypothetical protein